MSTTFDAIVIGGGIMGCSTALELAKRGLKTGLLEKGRIGAGPTGESSAIIRQHYSNELTARMAHFSLKVFQEFEDRVGEDCGFKSTGFVVLVAESDRHGLEANIKLQQGVGIDTRLISADEVRELMPGINIDDTTAAAYEPESGYADAYLTVNAYANAARRRGVSIRQNCSVTGITFEAGKVTGVRTPTETIAAPLVINCAGAWGALVGGMAGITLPISACRAQVAVLHRPEDLLGQHPVVIDFIHSCYFRSDAGQVMIAGLVDPAEANAVVDPDDYNRQTDFEFVSDVSERLVRRWPALERGEAREGFASLYAVTPDWHPIIDEIPHGSGFFVCSGFSGHGFKLGPAVGTMTADLVCGTSSVNFDVAAFSATRFAEGNLIRGRYEYSILG